MNKTNLGQREIRFRAWDKNNKLFVTWEQAFSDSDILASFFDGFYHPQQYTGLKDKNGKEIYEGDVVKWDGTQGYKVEFKNGAWVCSGWYLSSYEPAKLEVIGNIYENPELIAGKGGR